MKMFAERAVKARFWAPTAGVVLLGAVLSLSLGRLAGHSPVQQTILLAESPTGVAVDSRSGRVFITTSGPYGGGHVLVVDSGAGLLLRSIALDAAPLAQGVDEWAGHVLVVTDQRVYLLDATTGNVLRTTAMRDSSFSVAVDERTGRAFILGYVVRGSPALGSVRLSVLDTRSGAVLRTLEVGQLPILLDLDRRDGRVLLTSPDTGTTTTLYVLDARSGALLHIRRLNGYVTGMAVDERHGRAYLIGPATPRLRVLDTRSGILLRTLPLDARPMAVAVDQTTDDVFLQSAAGTRVLDTRTGRLMWVRGSKQSAPTHLLVDGGPRVVLASWGNGTLSLVDPRRGGHCVVTAGGDLVALATDERAARMVVLTGADMVPARDVDWTAWARVLLAWPPRLPTQPRRFVAGVVSILNTSCL
jgi:DNA-binding beta-propeller fold protein YncE